MSTSTATEDAFGDDPTACPECGRDACEDHVPLEASSGPPTNDVQHTAIGLTLRELHMYPFPVRRTLLTRGKTPIFCAGHIGGIYSVRGTGKTWFAQTLALVAASGGSALGFSAPSPVRVLYIDGEMAAGDIQKRFNFLCDRLHMVRTDNLVIVAADWQNPFPPRLDTPEGQQYVESHVEQADLIFLDNRSCLFDPEGEKDPAAWQPAQDWLLSLRRRGKAALPVHHSNRQGGARGHSKPEDAMDLLIKLTRPDDYVQDQGARFDVEFTKSRGAHGPDLAPFRARLTPDGWTTESTGTASNVRAKFIEYVRVCAAAGDRPKSKSSAVKGVGGNRAIGFRGVE